MFIHLFSCDCRLEKGTLLYLQTKKPHFMAGKCFGEELTKGEAEMGEASGKRGHAEHGGRGCRAGLVQKCMLGALDAHKLQAWGWQGSAMQEVRG